MKQELRELVEQMVVELLDEATYRKDYVNDVFNVLVGAIGEYYKARFAEVNGDPDPALRSHWDEEVEEHFMFRFQRIVNRRQKGAFDYTKAFGEAMVDLVDAAPHELKRSAREFAKDFKVSNANDLDYPPDSVTDEFIARCWNEFEARRRR